MLSVYATLSESAHPNFEGVCFGYSDVDEERDETVFGAKWFEMWGDKHNSLFMLTAVVFETKYNDVLAPQIEQLERWLTDNDKELQPLGGEDA